MSDYTINKIVFTKYDQNGDEICDQNGNPKLYTFKDWVDCSHIVETVSDDEVEEIKSNLPGLKTGKHIIFYKVITQQEIEIIRILH